MINELSSSDQSAKQKVFVSQGNAIRRSRNTSAVGQERAEFNHLAWFDREQAAMSGNKSFMRFEEARRIRMETVGPVMFC
jgi:hypothetical protein